MTLATAYSLTIFLGFAGFVWLRQRALVLRAQGHAVMPSPPRHYGYMGAAYSLIPALAVMLLWTSISPSLITELVLAELSPASFERLGGDYALLRNRLLLALDPAGTPDLNPDIAGACAGYRWYDQAGTALSAALALAAGGAGLMLARRRTIAAFAARAAIERLLHALLLLSSLIAVLITLTILLTLVYQSTVFFSRVPLTDFFLGTQWSPQTALRADQIAAAGSFGALPLFTGTFLIAGIAILVAGPTGLMIAFYLAFYAPRRQRALMRPVMDVLSVIPTVVFGFFAAAIIAPLLQRAGLLFSLDVASESALAAGLVMGVMITPYLSALGDHALRAVPAERIQASLALGATRYETIVNIVLPGAWQGLVGALLLALSRGVGETMVVVMAVSLRPAVTANPLDAVTTVTVQIASLLTGDANFSDLKALSAFALGLVLFTITLVFSLFARRFTNRGGRL